MTIRDLPPGWEWARFKDVARVASNLVDPSEHQSLPHIAPNHIESGTGRLLAYKTVGADGVTSPKHLFKPGQILYSKIRPYLAKAALVDFAGLCSADMYPVETELDPRFLLHWMISSEFTEAAARHQGRSVLPKINREALDELLVPVPPLEEQRRIVERLDEAISIADSALNGLKMAQRKALAAKRSILLAAVPSTAPPEWKMTTVAAAGELGLGLQRAPHRHNGPSMRPYLRVANVFEDRIDPTDVMEMNFTDEEYKKYQLLAGDVLLNEGQSPEFLGRPAMYRGTPSDVAFTNSLIRFRANDDVLPEWALLVFRRHMHSGRFQRESRVTTNIAHLSLNRLKKVEFPIPPLSVQRQVVAETAAALSTLEAAETAIAVLSKKADRLRKSIVSSAFAGDLTPQDPADEPASVLLKKLQDGACGQSAPRKRKVSK